MAKGKNLQRWAARRADRRAKRRAAKQDEANRRKTADQQNAQAVSEWQGLQGSIPNPDAQVAANRQLWNSGSQEAKVDTSQLQEIANQGYNQADEASLQAAQNQANQSAAAQRAATMQQAASRGQAGGGLAMMGALAANQGAANAGQANAANIAQSRIQARQQGAQNLFAARTGQGQAVDAFNQGMLQNQQNLQQQNFANQGQAVQGLTGQLGQSAQYNQDQADKARQRRLSFANFLSNPMGGMR
jgi:hypothetical protein